MRARLSTPVRLPSIELRLTPHPTSIGLAGYANQSPVASNAKQGISWPTKSSIPSVLGSPAKTLQELREMPMQEQQSFHRAAMARLRVCLGMGWAPGPLSGAKDQAGEVSAARACDAEASAEKKTYTRSAELRLGSRSSRLKQAMHLAHLLLSGPSPSSKAEPSAAPRLARCALYTRLISAFCGAGYPQVGLALLNKQKQENDNLGEEQEIKLESDPRDVSMVLGGLVKDVPSGEGGMAVLEQIMPLLPDDLDTVLLTQVVRVMVAHTASPPEEVRDIIHRCLRATSGEAPSTTSPLSGTASASGSLTDTAMDQWEWGLWDVYLSSFEGPHGWKQALLVLGDFCRVVRTEKQRRIEAQSATLQQTASVWSSHDIALIQRPFITVMSLFAQSSNANSASRLALRDTGVPRTLVRDYLGLIHEPGGSSTADADANHMSISLELANVWMHSERIAGRAQQAERIWEMMSGMTVEGGRADRAKAADRLLGLGTRSNGWTGTIQADSYTYQTLFKLLSQTGRYPSPTIIHQFLELPDAQTALSLNAGLSALLHWGNLLSAPSSASASGASTGAPLAQHVEDQARERLILAWQLLRAFPSRQGGSAMNDPDRHMTERTVDIVAAGLVKMWRAGLPVLPAEERARIPESPAARQARRQARDGVSRHTATKGDGRGVRVGADGLPLWISLSEWQLITLELHRLRLDAATAQADAVRSTTGPPKIPTAIRRIDLPMRRPIARMDANADTSTVPDKLTGSNASALTSILYAQPSAILRRAQSMQEPLLRLIGRALQTLAERRDEVDTDCHTDTGAVRDRENGDSMLEHGNRAELGRGEYAERMQAEEVRWVEGRVGQRDLAVQQA